MSVTQRAIEIMGTPPPDKSGISDTIHIKSAEGHSLFCQRYNSGRIDMVTFVDGTPFESFDVKNANWNDLVERTGRMITEGWVHIE